MEPSDGRRGHAGAHRSLPLDDLRAALLRDDHQLHRPPDPRPARADAVASDIGWNEQQYGDDRVVVLGRVRARLSLRRPHHGSLRHAARIRRLDRRLEPGGDVDGARANGGRFSAARFALGLGESGNFPASIKTVAEWFPARERAFATGIFNAGSNVGAIVTPIVVPWIALTWGWRAAFIATGALGFLWLVAWLADLSAAGATSEVSPGGARAHSQRSVRAGASRCAGSSCCGIARRGRSRSAKFMTDPIWWFYLYWLPKFLDARYGIKLGSVAAPLVVIYLLADVGSVFGGWLSGAFIKRGWSVNAGRKTTMLIAGAAHRADDVRARGERTCGSRWSIVGVAAAAHQWWSANIFTLSSDMFPRSALGSVVGIGGFFGAAGGVLFQRATGWVLQHNGSNYTPIFLVCGLAYVSALLVIQLLAPKLKPAEL